MRRRQLGIMYFLMGLLVALFFLFATFFGHEGGVAGVAFVILIPFLYGAIGYVVVAVSAVVYNVLVRFIGGLEITVNVMDRHHE